LINGNTTDLNPKNLAPLGEVDFPRKVKGGQQVTVTYHLGESSLIKVFYKVVDMTSTSGADKLILVETGRKDLE